MDGLLCRQSPWKYSINAAIGGIWMLLNPPAFKSLNRTEKIHPRMMCATFNGDPFVTAIFPYQTHFRTKTFRSSVMIGMFIYAKTEIINSVYTILSSCLVLWNTPTVPLQTGKIRPPPQKSVLDMTLNSEVPVMLGLLRMRSTPLLPSLPGPLWPGVVAPDKVLSMSQIGLNCVLMLNCITWNTTHLTFKLRTYAELNC